MVGAERQTAEEVTAPIDRGFGQVEEIIDEGNGSHQDKQDTVYIAEGNICGKNKQNKRHDYVRTAAYTEM